MILKQNSFKNYINSKESSFRILGIKKYKLKGTLFCTKFIRSQIDFGHYKEFQVTKTELTSYFKYNQKQCVTNNLKLNNQKLNLIFKGLESYKTPLLNNCISKKKLHKLSKTLKAIKSLRKYLYYKRITIGRFIRTKRGGFTIGLSGRLAFLPQSHLFSKNKIKNLVGIALPIKILSIKGSKNKRKKTYTLNIIVSNRQAIRAILTHNKKINPERIIKLNKLYTVCQ